MEKSANNAEEPLGFSKNDIEKFTYDFRWESNEIKVAGFRCDTVVEVLPDPRPGVFRDVDAREVDCSTNSTMRGLFFRFFEQIDAFCSSPNLKMKSRDTVLRSLFNEGSEPSWRHLDKRLRKMRSWLQDHYEPSRHDERMELFYGCLRVVYQGHALSFFITASGKLGRADDPVRVGDTIAVFPGGSFLYILTPDCKRYITHAWVKGWMDSEAADLYRRGEAQLEEFAIA